MVDDVKSTNEEFNQYSTIFLSIDVRDNSAKCGQKKRKTRCVFLIILGFPVFISFYFDG